MVRIVESKNCLWNVTLKPSNCFLPGIYQVILQLVHIMEVITWAIIPEEVFPEQVMRGQVIRAGIRQGVTSKEVLPQLVVP